MRLAQVVLLSGTRRFLFTVEVPVTRRQYLTGWMYRSWAPPPGRGMLFVVSPPRPFTMWMANTRVPLDILFVGADGRVVQVAAGRPFDRTLLRCPVPVGAVLEVAGGTARRLGIRPGDIVLLP